MKIHDLNYVEKVFCYNTPMKTKEPSLVDWNRLVKEGLSYEGSNTKEEFAKMSKKYGLAFIFYLEAAYSVKDELTDEEFCRLNGNVPVKFLEKFK